MRYCGLVYMVFLLTVGLGRTQTSTNTTYTVRTTNGAIIIRARTKPAEPAGAAAPTAIPAEHLTHVERVHRIERVQNEIQPVTLKIRPATFD